MDSVVKEYCWTEDGDTFVCETDGVAKRLKIQPNMILTRMCTQRSDKWLIGESKLAADPMYEQYLAKLKDGYCNFVEVMAVGRRRDWTKKEQKKYNVAKRFTLEVKPGDMLLMPERDMWGRLWRYIFGKPYLHICETHVPILQVSS